MYVDWSCHQPANTLNHFHGADCDSAGPSNDKCWISQIDWFGDFTAGTWPRGPHGFQ